MNYTEMLFNRDERLVNLLNQADSKNLELIEEINNREDEIERLHSIIKALHKYFEEHEQYEDNEFLRQLESTTENDKEWLKKMGKYE